mmetsp:Transcript_121951/g.211705  ORF Transcript_121951/g.211705 Transcript_121951/m.211705 type:complete len:82 (-) Transcript_121951:126-371(-)
MHGPFRTEVYMATQVSTHCVCTGGRPLALVPKHTHTPTSRSFRPNLMGPPPCMVSQETHQDQPPLPCKAPGTPPTPHTLLR